MEVFGIILVRTLRRCGIESQRWMVEILESNFTGVEADQRDLAKSAEKSATTFFARTRSVGERFEQRCLLVGRKLGERLPKVNSLYAFNPASPVRKLYCMAGSLATMKSMNSATPASLAPGVASLGIMISANLSTIAYSAAVKNCGRYLAGLICRATLPTCPQAKTHLLKPGNCAAADAVARMRKTSRRSMLCPAMNSFRP